MARLNIEDSLFKDARFFELCIKMGSRRVAIGALIEAWILAQQHVTIDNPIGLIPVKDWVEQDIAKEVIASKLAIEKDGFVEIVGGQKNFAWLVQKKEAAKKGGDAKSELAKRSEAEQLAIAIRELNEGCPPTLTPSLSLSLDPVLATDSGSKKREVNEVTKHWFYKFLIEKLGSLDLGLLNYLPKVEKAFVNEEGFSEWLDLLMLAQNFQSADLKHQQKYCIKALKDEMKSRGCL